MNQLLDRRIVRRGLIALVILSASLIVGASLAARGAEPKTPQKADAGVKIPPEIIAGIIRVESGGNPLAIGYNRDGSVDLGLVQINSQYLAYFARIYNLPNLNPFDPKQSRAFLRAHLLGLFHKTGSWPAAVCAYRYGATGSQRIDPATDVYVRRVIGGGW